MSLPIVVILLIVTHKLDGMANTQVDFQLVNSFPDKLSCEAVAKSRRDSSHQAFCIEVTPMEPAYGQGQ